MKKSTRTALVLLSGAGVMAALGGGAVALASTASPIPAHTIHGCVTGSTRTLEHVFTLSSNGTKCPKGSFMVILPTGAPKAAVAGPSGVVATRTSDLDGVSSVPTGGGFIANSVEVGTVDLSAGTYLLSLNAKATPNAVTPGAVFPQFFVYDQPKNGDFTGDLFNVGSGSLEQFTTSVATTTIDSYYSGSTVVTLAGDTTLHVYAFGYDSDQGAGSYTLDDLSITATQINPSP